MIPAYGEEREPGEAIETAEGELFLDGEGTAGAEAQMGLDDQPSDRVAVHRLESHPPPVVEEHRLEGDARARDPRATVAHRVPDPHTRGEGSTRLAPAAPIEPGLLRPSRLVEWAHPDEEPVRLRRHRREFGYPVVASDLFVHPFEGESHREGPRANPHLAAKGRGQIAPVGPDGREHRPIERAPEHALLHSSRPEAPRHRVIEGEPHPHALRRGRGDTDGEIDRIAAGGGGQPGRLDPIGATESEDPRRERGGVQRAMGSRHQPATHERRIAGVRRDDRDLTDPAQRGDGVRHHALGAHAARAPQRGIRCAATEPHQGVDRRGTEVEHPERLGRMPQDHIPRAREERVLDEEELEERVRHREGIGALREVGEWGAHRGDDHALRPERPGDAHRGVGADPTIHQHAPIAHDRPQQHGDPHTRPERLPEIAAVEHHHLTRREVGRDGTEGDGKAIEVSPCDKIRAQAERREDRVRLPLADRAALQHPPRGGALPHDRRRESDEGGGEGGIVVMDHRVESRLSDPLADARGRFPRRVERPDHRPHARADDQVGDDPEGVERLQDAEVGEPLRPAPAEDERGARGRTGGGLSHRRARRCHEGDHRAEKEEGGAHLPSIWRRCSFRFL